MLYASRHINLSCFDSEFEFLLYQVDVERLGTNGRTRVKIMEARHDRNWTTLKEQ